MWTYNQPAQEELYHYGVPGMKWGVRKSQPSTAKKILTKTGESVDLHRDKESTFAKFLGSINSKIKAEQSKYEGYTIKSKSGKKVGNLDLYRESKDSMNIVWLGVNNKQMGNGYAQSALKIAMSHAKDSGCKQVTLEVPTTSPNAKHIYEKYGFKETGEKMLGDENYVWGGLTKMALHL